MNYRRTLESSRLTAVAWVLFIGAALGLSISAQEEESAEDEAVIVAEDEQQDDPGVADDDEPVEEIIVTGSRLRRSTFESISPLQVIDAEVSREAGLIETTEILQQSNQAAGIQTDQTFGGFVLDNGPGSETVDLRGLEPDRTLILINGRRVAPAGVGGAPSSPDTSLVPGILVQDYEVLLDGASSIYGSDAIAGVTNVILRKDFEGFEFSAFSSGSVGYKDELPQNVSIAWGQTYDRGFVGAAAAYVNYPAITWNDSAFASECEKNIEYTQSGELRVGIDEYWKYWYGDDLGECRYSGVTNALLRVPGGNWIFYTPGESNGGWPNFSENRYRLGSGRFWIDEDGDGVNDVTYKDYSFNGRDGYAHMYPNFTRTNYMAYGEYMLDTAWNVTPYFEVLYSRRHTDSLGDAPQLFPVVSAFNPYNPCNPLGYGVDCGLAWDAFINNPALVSQVFDAFGCTISSGGTCDQTIGPTGPRPVQPVVRVTGDRNHSKVTVSQYRYVAGMNMELPFLDIGMLSGWGADFSISHSYSIGLQNQQGIRADRLDAALGHFSATGTPCDIHPSQIPLIEPDTVPGCVPVNLFAPSLWDSEDLRGDFATEAERMYLFDSRDFDTRYRQTTYSTFLSGTVGRTPYGPIAAGWGIDIRRDWIDSIPNAVASKGLFWGYSVDEGAAGKKTTEELYAETEIPVLAGIFLADELTVNLSGRITSDEYYGSHETYSAKAAWRPINWLLFRATTGTSYRSPNLRNLFLRGQTGFLNVTDPCFIPVNALDEITGEYIPSADTRSDILLDNCRAHDVDPTLANRGGFNTYNIEVKSGGSLDLNPETATSETYGLVFEQPFTNAFTYTLGVSFYEIVVDDTVIEPSLGYIVADCYYNEVIGGSAFCSRIERDRTDPTSPLITLVNRGVLNRDNEKVRGIDINMYFYDQVTIGGIPLNLTLDYNGHRLKQRSSRFLNESGARDESYYDTEWGYPRWRQQATAAIEWNTWRFAWFVRSLSKQDIDEEFKTEDWFGSVTQFGKDTCLGPPTDELCHDVSESDRYFEHTVSVRYQRPLGGLIVSAGIANVTNEPPPMVDTWGTFSYRNVPFGAGYDLLGRSYYANIAFDLSIF